VTFTGVERLREEEEAPPAPSSFPHPPPAAVRFPFLDHLLHCMIAAGQGVQALCFFLQLTREALDAHIVRLGLATPHDRPMRKGGAKAWSGPDAFLASVLRRIGVHPQVIGRVLSKPRTANAVRTKLRRMGVRGPSRAELFKPDPASLRLPDAGMIERLMLSQADLTTTVHTLRAFVAGGPGQSNATAPTRRTGKARSGGVIRSEGQRELPLIGIVAGRDKDEAAKPAIVAAPAATPVPAKEELVDFNDLTWFRSLVGKNPLTNRVAVYVVGMLILGGLHYKEAAKRLGLSGPSYRTFRTNMDVPVDSDRSKAGTQFDEEAAKITLLESGYELRLCMQTRKNWFWVKKSDRGTRLSPPCRTKERFIGDRSNKIKIVTRRMLDAERGSWRAPFAKSSARVAA
jgi:hypothetical protein